MVQEIMAVEENAIEIENQKEASKKEKEEKISAERKKADDLRKLSINDYRTGVAISAETVEAGSNQARALNILMMRDSINTGVLDSEEAPKKKRIYNVIRPDNWRVITQYFIDNGFNHLRSVFGKDVDMYTDKALKLNLKRAWVPDLNNRVTNEDLKMRLTSHKPGYGVEKPSNVV
jgi:hypothetical protein